MMTSEKMMPKVRRMCVAVCIQLQTTAMQQQYKIETIAEVPNHPEHHPLVSRRIPIKFLSSWPKRSMVDKQLVTQLETWRKAGNTYAKKLNMRVPIDDKIKFKQFK